MEASIESVDDNGAIMARGSAGTVTDISRGLYTKDVKSIQMRVRVTDETRMKMYYASNEFDGFSEGDATGNYTILSTESVPADGKWHIINFTPTSDAWVNNPTKVLHQSWFGATERPAYVEIDWIRFMGEGAVKTVTDESGTHELKYGVGESVINSGTDKCDITFPSLINYSSENMNIGFIAGSYVNGKISDIKFVSKPAAAGRTIPSDSITLNSVPENAEIKIFIWDMKTLKPISSKDYYDDMLPSQGGAVEPDDPEIQVEPDDTDFEGKKKVLIIGNSYTRHNPATIFINGQTVKWRGKWGMAASAQSKDYVHLLKSYAKAQNEDVAFMIKTIYEYEHNPNMYQDQLSMLDEPAALNADIIILAIGTNIDADRKDYVADAYRAMIDKLDPDHNATIICAMLLGVADSVKYEMYRVANEKGCVWVDLTDKNTGEYLAVEQYGENGVGWHYGDYGMKMVADNIWNGREYLADYIKTTGDSDETNVKFRGLKDYISAGN